jgi:hypothetical protein
MGNSAIESGVTSRARPVGPLVTYRRNPERGTTQSLSLHVGGTTSIRRRIGMAVRFDRILKGEKAADLPAAFPSHGRGRRFNPYSAHHFSSIFSAPLGTNQHQSAPIGTLRRGADVEYDRVLFTRRRERTLGSSLSTMMPSSSARVRRNKWTSYD